MLANNVNSISVSILCIVSSFRLVQEPYQEHWTRYWYNMQEIYPSIPSTPSLCVQTYIQECGKSLTYKVNASPRYHWCWNSFSEKYLQFTSSSSERRNYQLTTFIFLTANNLDFSQRGVHVTKVYFIHFFNKA